MLARRLTPSSTERRCSPKSRALGQPRTAQPTPTTLSRVSPDRVRMPRRPALGARDASEGTEPRPRDESRPPANAKQNENAAEAKHAALQSNGSGAERRATIGDPRSRTADAQRVRSSDWLDVDHHADTTLAARTARDEERSSADDCTSLGPSAKLRAATSNESAEVLANRGEQAILLAGASGRSEPTCTRIDGLPERHDSESLERQANAPDDRRRSSLRPEAGTASARTRSSELLSMA